MNEALPRDGAAALHVMCWAETYRGMLPDPLIDSMNVPSRTIQWQRALERRADVQVIVAEDASGGLLRFASGGPARGADLGAVQEIYAICVLRQAQRHGLGRALLQSLAARLVLKSMTPAALNIGLWVLRDNTPARTFYKRLGGQPGDERTEKREGHDLTEAAYRWSDLTATLGALSCSGALDGSGPGFA